ncbi:MAG: heavy-metal-associated domain-containing protein [Bacteroidaceae bacterium]|nr:heavy-metal-associated domain-containing protein [Bacteroidaceae bacterium]
MTCHHCAANVQKSIASVEGVTKATVSLEEKTAYVEGEFSTDDIRKAVESIGFEIEM